MKIKTLTLSMSPELYEALTKESERMGIPVARMVHTVLENWLAERRLDLPDEDLKETTELRRWKRSS